MTFSERYGYKQVRESLQFESMDMDLRNGIWNTINILYLKDIRDNQNLQYLDSFQMKERSFRDFSSSFWVNYLKKPYDEISFDSRWAKKKIKDYILNSEWFEVYDFLEFFVDNYKPRDSKPIEDFLSIANGLFEKEMSAYRYVDNLITPITSEEEILEIEDAEKHEVGAVGVHIRRALEFLSDKRAPDYRNSIKESISAVESLACNISGNGSGTLGKLLEEVGRVTNLHPALKSSFAKLYGWTSDEGGIRHALQDQDNVDFNDAKYMLVVCSAFVNYVESKMEKGTG